MMRPVTGRVGRNSIFLNMTGQIDDGDLTVNIQDIHLNDIGDIFISTGTDFVSYVEDQIMNKIISDFSNTIFHAVDSALKTLRGRKFQFKGIFKSESS